MINVIRQKNEIEELEKLYQNGRPEDCKKIVRLLVKRHIDYTREEIAEEAGLPLVGGLTDTLSALIGKPQKKCILYPSSISIRL